VIGYFNDNVINLDGKLNPRALTATQHGRLGEYLAQEEIDYVVDWKPVIQDFLRTQTDASQWQPCEHSIGNGLSACVQRRIRQSEGLYRATRQ